MRQICVFFGKDEILAKLLKFLVNFTLLKYVKSQKSYGFSITKELIFGFQTLDLNSLLKSYFYIAGRIAYYSKEKINLFPTDGTFESRDMFSLINL